MTLHLIINAGPDQTICVGNPAILNVTGCFGTPLWYQLTQEGPILVGQGEVLDVFPQTSACYIVICCITPACCDTDTVCINVMPLPVLHWSNQYLSICDTGSFVLNPMDVQVFINNTWVNAPLAGGTGYFYGPGVSGNIFTPTGPGVYTICYSYTDTNGCTSIICNTITVITCCDPSFNVDAGPDQTICVGNPAILQVSGCTGTAQWYQLTQEGPIPVGQGEVVDIFPQTSACYIVICCITPACCDTDTVCINVMPLPVLHWSNQYLSICDTGSFVLNPMYVQVFINNTWVNAPLAGGTGYFYGPGVSGNIFTPTGPGVYTICYSYTDTNGCTSTICNTITVITCCDPAFNINAGRDTTICLGNSLPLVVSGCNGNAIWHQLTMEGPIVIGQGPDVIITPQQTTCYMVTCCITPTCCDTDTVCVNVELPTFLVWQEQFDTLCAGTGIITFNLNNIYVSINNTMVMLPYSGGSWVFSGTGVVSNTFNPTTPGTYVITLTYTSPGGCVMTITNTITVIECLPCDPAFSIDAGPDQTICVGNPAILQVSGCNGTPQWYQLTQEGPIFVGGGQVLDIFPQSSACYIVICCINTLCCDTDTVCINVDIQTFMVWHEQFDTLCAGTGIITFNLNNIFVSINNTMVMLPFTGGSWVFSGTGVVGNTFNPTTPGTYVITLTYTSPGGCVMTVTKTITVIECIPCDPAFNIDAGPDQTICLGNPAILQVSGCSGTPQWYQLTQEGPIFVGGGEVLDIFPQSSACYIVICCINTLCCDTDTICINVVPPPILSWPGKFDELCSNAGPITLNPNDIFVDINQTWVMSTFAGGTGIFSGTGVVGNTFTPSAPGVYTICFTYILNGCSSTICKTITVVQCCDTLFNVDAGPDQMVCLGNSTTLTVEGCNGVPQWYELNIEGPIFVGEGPSVTITPQQTICYMVICCISPVCCDTDTVCVNVAPSLGRPQWMVSYASVCQYGAPIMLDANNIFYTNVYPWIPVTLAGGFGAFSGQNVVGGYFYPTVLGLNTITYTYTDANGCVYVLTNTIMVTSCGCGPCYHPGTDMIANSGFESGNVGFTSSLSSACSCTSGTYCINTNAQGKCAGFLNLTSASIPTGNKFMIVDGNTSSSMIWKQSVTILNTQTYNFVFWVHPSVASVGGQQPDLQVRVNGTPIMTLPGASLLPTWRRYFVQITGIAGSTIEIHQLNYLPAGTAYGLDDISLKQCVRNIIIDFNPVTAVSCHGLDDGSATGVVTGGTQPYTYQWSSGEVSPTIIEKVAGLYTLTVVDGIGCNHFEAVSINEPDPILISGFTPTSGSGGTQVIITGSGFTNVNQVSFNGIFSSVYHVDSPTQITAIVPNGVTSGTITLSNPSGCSGTSTGIFTVNSIVTINLGVLIQGFYIGSNQLTPVLNNVGISQDPTDVDTVVVELHEMTLPYSTVATTSGILKTNGELSVQFPAAYANGDYYLVIRHRNSIETWSKDPVHLLNTTNFDFAH